MTLTYLLPIKASDAPSWEMTQYLAMIGRHCRLIVVDGSDGEVFSAAHAAWGRLGLHIAPDPSIQAANGKVRGVLTGLALVRTDALVIADDDVRYTLESLTRIEQELEGADVVLPQNYFQPLPWHAKWDTARTLLNRATGGDFPGTMGVRTAPIQFAGGYDGDVLFENLELMRTVDALGGRSMRVPSLFVRRLPPSTRHFLSQRVRQAYDEFARPLRMIVWLALLPLLFSLRRWAPVALLSSVAIAECGRRRDGGRARFPWTCTLFAPAWVLERAVCVWVSIALRLRGGVRYSGGRLARAANSRRSLRSRVNNTVSAPF